MISCSEEGNESITPEIPVKPSSGIINDVIDGNPYVVFANERTGFYSAFSRMFQGQELSFELSENTFPNRLLDNNGNVWDVFGHGVSPEIQGQKLEEVSNIIGYWFFFPSFYNEIELANGTTIDGVDRIPNDSEWLISTSNISQGSFRDGIRSIDAPTFLKSDGKSFVDDPFYSSLGSDEFVTVMEVDEDYRVYPHRIMEYHEIVNDINDDICYTISFCPLTGTSRVWESKVASDVTEFGVSGLLYNNNLILYDRKSESHWSQILDLSVNGQMIGERANVKQVYEMRYGDLSTLDGEVYLLDPNSGNFASYSTSQYADYLTNEFIFFRLAVSDNSIPMKERVIGVVSGEKAKVFRFSDFK